MSSADKRPPASEPIEDTAATWLARRDRGFREDEAEQFAAWLEADEAHVEAVAQLESAWSALDRLEQLAPPSLVRPDPDLLAASAITASRPRGRRYYPAAIGLAAAMAVGVFWLSWPSRPSPPSPVAAAAPPPVAAPLKPQRLILPDGSQVELNGESLVEESFTATERRVRLVQGEANFIVAPEAARPFLVQAGGVVLRAVGTVFNVRLQPGEVEVVVTEGKVQVTRDEASPTFSSPPLLTAGHRGVISTNETEVRAWEPASPEVMQRLRAWQSVRLVFDEQTLEEIVAQFNRSGPRRLVIGDARLKDLRIGGNFRSDNVDAFVRLLQLSFGIVGDEVGGEIVLRRPE